MRKHCLIIGLATLIVFGCKERGAPAGGGRKDSGARNGRDSNVKASAAAPSLKVSARLIYDDGTFSGFDILNDKRKALWNVIIGEGDAEKASHNTKVSLDGELDSLQIRIRDKRTLFVDTSVLRLDKHLDFVLKETGCDEVFVRVLRNKKTVYNDTIPFHCGE